MPKMLTLIQQIGGSPQLDPVVTPYRGYSLGGQAGNWGLYVLSGTGPQLTAINALAQVIGLVTVTGTGVLRWPELDSVVTTTIRTRVNTWVAARGWPTIPAGWTYRQIVQAILQRMGFDDSLRIWDVIDG